MYGLSIGSYHQFKLFMDIIRDMEELCPDAWYIQCANPVFDGCTLVTRRSDVKTVGLCHGFHGGTQRIARVLGLDSEQVEARAYGINHFIWLTKFRYQGRDAYPILDRWIEEKAESFWASSACSISDGMGPKAVDVYKRLGLFPVGDTVSPGGGSYFHWYHTNRETEERWHEDSLGWFDRHVERVTKQLDEMFRTVADPSVRVTDVFSTQGTGETNVSIIDAIANDKPAVFQVNIPNRGAIPGVADDVVVEIPALVSASGIQGLHMGDLPRPIMCHLLEKVMLMERNLEAFQTGEKRTLLELVLASPWTQSIEQAQGVLDELLALPFNRDMAKYFEQED